jgi:hypothetical protein
MNMNPENPSRKLIWISLAVNLLFCITALPILLQSGSFFKSRQLFETLFWQGISIIAWPVAMIVGFLDFLGTGNLLDLRTTLSLAIYPLIWLAVLLLIFSKKGKWISLAILHILLVLSFIITWFPVFNGYNFMVG